MGGGGWKMRGGGGENLTNDTPPKRGFWTPPFVRYVFHPFQVLVLCFPAQKSTTEQTRRSFGGVQKFSGERVLWYVFLPPYVLHPLISRLDNRQITHLICVRLKHLLYDFLGGDYGPFI